MTTLDPQWVEALGQRFVETLAQYKELWEADEDGIVYMPVYYVLKRIETGNPTWPLINTHMSVAELYQGSDNECMHGVELGDCNACGSD